MRCCGAGLATVLREANRDDSSGDLFGKLKADVRVTRQPRQRSAADALRILLVMACGFCQRRDLLVEHKNRGQPSRMVDRPLRRPMINKCGFAT